MGAGEGCLLLKRGFLSGDFGICEKLSAVGILSFYAGPFSSSLDITHFFNVFKMAEMKNKTYSKLFKDRIRVLFRANALIHDTCYVLRKAWENIFSIFILVAKTLLMTRVINLKPKITGSRGK